MLAPRVVFLSAPNSAPGGIVEDELKKRVMAWRPFANRPHRQGEAARQTLTIAYPSLAEG